MAGTLSATVAKPAVAENITADFSADGVLLAATFAQNYAVSGALSAVGALTATAIPRFTVAAALSGAGVLSSAAIKPGYAKTLPLSAVGTLAATVVRGGAHYSDTFNRANTTTLGANWTHRNTAPADQFQIAGNMAAAATTAAYPASVSFWTQPMQSNNHKVSITVKGLGFFGAVLRSNANVEQIGFYVYSGTGDAYLISGNPAEYLFAATPIATFSTGVAPADGDVFTLEANGGRYTFSKNGVAVGSWTDTGSLYTPYVDSSHREVGIIATSILGTLTAGIDSWSADDVDPRNDVDFGGTGTLSATVVKSFEQFTEINTPRSSQPIPANLPTGVWITMIGQAGSGGSGRRATLSAGGGSGGGGGSIVPRFFVPKTSLAGAYTVQVATTERAGGTGQGTTSTNGNAGTAGTSTYFSSSTTYTAGGGGAGLGGTNASGVAGGAGGTVSGATGVTGAQGGPGNLTTGGAGGAAATSGAGGGGGGGISGGGAKAAGGAGGSNNNGTGGVAGNNSTVPHGGQGSALTDGLAGSAGGGGGAGSSIAGMGGGGVGYGAGGGGSAGFSTATAAGGTGGRGYIKLEWV